MTAAGWTTPHNNGGAPKNHLVHAHAMVRTRNAVARHSDKPDELPDVIKNSGTTVMYINKQNDETFDVHMNLTQNQLWILKRALEIYSNKSTIQDAHDMYADLHRKTNGLFTKHLSNA